MLGAMRILLPALALVSALQGLAHPAQDKNLPRPGEVFAVDGRTAFVIEPEREPGSTGPMPWVWYAPTLPRLPGGEEGWMFDRFLAEGIAIAGIDVGESYGSPRGVEGFQALYEHLTGERGYAPRPALLARSRGGLMAYAWAAAHPGSVAGVGGIYPVCDLRSYPGVARAARSFGLSEEELRASLDRHNPIECLVPLAEAGVPVLHIHGDRDATVPLEANSAELARRFHAAGGHAEVRVLEGRGHDMWSGWFQSSELTDFLVERAHAGAGVVDEGPVQVYILSGQSNMVGIGQVSGGSTRWGKEIIDPVVSVYEGAYSAEADYDSRTPRTELALAEYGGVKPTPFPGGGTHVVRGQIRIEDAGLYEFNPGYAGSSHNVMEVDGTEVYRCEVGGEPSRTPFRFEAGRSYPFKITFLTGAADGLGWLWRADLPGTLSTLVRAEGRFPHLLNEDGGWAERDDVWYRGLVTAVGDRPLGVGCGANRNSIGPELGFGHVMGDHHDAPVLVIKASQGNRSLGWDYLPPGSPRFTHGGRTYAGYGDRIPSWTEDDPGKEVDWYAGLQYDQCFEAVREVLDDFDASFPQYAGRGFEVAGFAWWQGHKDGNDAHASQYETNLVRLIKSLREMFDAPDAPFVIGTIGFGGWDMAGPHLAVAEAQLAVSGQTGRHPEFEGNVLTVETRDFWREPDVSPRNQGFHYNGNAETYLLVGEALGRGMVELLGGR